MTRTQIQLPDPLFRRLKAIASARDWSLAELIRRASEAYVQSCPEPENAKAPWSMPVLRGSGGMISDPATLRPEAEAVEAKCRR